MDLIRQQLEFEAQQLRSVMEERFGTSDEMVQRTQVKNEMKMKWNAKWANHVVIYNMPLPKEYIFATLM